MFLDESAEWEDESTLNTPAKQNINTYFPDYDETPHHKQTISHIIQSQPQNSQPTTSIVTSQSTTSGSQPSQSTATTSHISQSQTIRRPPNPEPDELEDDDEEVPQSQLLQKLFPSVRMECQSFNK